MVGAGKAAVWLQIAVVLGLIGFATWQLFTGNFAVAMATFPLLVVFWFFLSYFHRR